MTVCSCHVTYAFHSESTFYSFLKVKELRREIWRLSNCNWTRTEKNLVRKRTFNHLAKWLSVRLQTKWFWVRVQLQSQNVAVKLVQTLSNLWISNLQFYAVYFYCVPSWGLSKYIETKLHPFAFTSYKAFSKKQKVVWN